MDPNGALWMPPATTQWGCGWIFSSLSLRMRPQTLSWHLDCNRERLWSRGPGCVLPRILSRGSWAWFVWYVHTGHHRPAEKGTNLWRMPQCQVKEARLKHPYYDSTHKKFLGTTVETANQWYPRSVNEGEDSLQMHAREFGGHDYRVLKLDLRLPSSGNLLTLSKLPFTALLCVNCVWYVNHTSIQLRWKCVSKKI